MPQNVEIEIARLDDIVNADESTKEQRDAAKEAWNKLLDDQIAAAWSDIEDRTDEYNALVDRLTAVVDKIAANQITTAIDDITGVLNDVNNAANPPEDGGNG